MGSLKSDTFGVGSPADGTALHSYDANWVNPYGGDLEIKTNAVAASSTGRCASRYDGVVYPNNQYCKATVVAASAYEWAVAVRHITSSAITYYGGGSNPGEYGHSRYAIWKYAANVFTNLTAHGSQVLTAADVVMLTVETNGSDADLKLYVTDMVTPLLTISDTSSPLASGSAALVLFHSAASVALMDTFDSGDLASGTTPLVGAGSLTGIASRMDLGITGRSMIRG